MVSGRPVQRSQTTRGAKVMVCRHVDQSPQPGDAIVLPEAWLPMMLVESGPGGQWRSEIRVLVIEDNRSDARLIECLLDAFQERSDANFRTCCVATLAEALGVLPTFSPHVILLDLGLPDSQGMETLSRVRSRCDGLPIVVLTGNEDLDLAMMAIRAGVQDFLVKTEMAGETLGRSVRYALERSRRQQLELEVANAGVMQRQLLHPDTDGVGGLEIAARCEPVTLLGGDFVDVIALPHQRTALALADVSGHGLGPALLMAEARGVLRTLARTEPDPGRILTQLNQIISGDCTQGSFVTVFLAVLDPQTHQLRYACGGHDGYLVDSVGNVRHQLAASTPPLGIVPDQLYTSSQPLAVGKNDIVLSCTDGVTEGYCRSRDRFFGIDSVLECVKRRISRRVDDVLAGVFAAVGQFQDQQHDDMSAFLARVAT